VARIGKDRAAIPATASHVTAWREADMRITIPERLRYRFDNAMARGTSALIGLLALASIALVAVVAALVMLFTPASVDGTSDALWLSLLRTLDPGTMGGDTGTAPFLVLMLTVTVGGIFIVSSLVGVLATGLDARLARLRKGKSRVVERGHTIILGWSDQLFTIVSELAQADQREQICVVILANRDKVEMEDLIRQRLPRLGRVRVVCRTGNPAAPMDLEIVRPDAASVIIVPTPDGIDPDIQVIKNLLALEHRAWPSGRPPIVAAIADSTNLAAATLAGTDVTFVDAEDVTARLIVQSRRHPGLSAVCTDLLSFAGEEIHTRAEPDLVGRTYGHALTAYETATVFGIRRGDGTVAVNPPDRTVLVENDQLIVLAASRRSIRRAHTEAPVIAEAISTRPRTPEQAESTLVLGWNGQGPTIVRLLDQYLPAGSALTIAATGLNPQAGDTFGALENLTVTVTRADPTSRTDLETLHLGAFQHVMVLAGGGDIDAESADARTLITLLHLRDLKRRKGLAYTIVGEISDDANRDLAQVTRADDFVVSTKMISLLMAQLSRNSHLAGVFAELFDPRGSDIYLKPAADYVTSAATANFATVIAAARRRGETAIGYRLDRESHMSPDFGVVLNPDKTQPLTLQAADRVVVLAD
jgi:voltage-gated potassium channel Kch